VVSLEAKSKQGMKRRKVTLYLKTSEWKLNGSDSLKKLGVSCWLVQRLVCYLHLHW